MNNIVLIIGSNDGIAQAIKALLEKDGYVVFAPSRTEMYVPIGKA